MKIRVKKSDAKKRLLKEASEKETVKTKTKVSSKEDAKKKLKTGKKSVKLEAKGKKAKGGKTRKPSVGSKEKQQELQAILGDCRSAIEKHCRIYEAANGTVARVFTKKSKGQNVSTEGFICEINTSHLFDMKQAILARQENKKALGDKSDVKGFHKLSAIAYKSKSQLLGIIKAIK